MLIPSFISSQFISASAGSGKTTTLIDRIVHLLENGVEGNKILCLTFTKVAAKEMEERLRKKLHAANHDIDTDTEANTQPDQLAPKFATIHSYAQFLIYKFHAELGITQEFKVLDDVDTKDLLNEVMQSPDTFKNDEGYLEILFEKMGLERFYDNIFEFIKNSALLERHGVDKQQGYSGALLAQKRGFCDRNYSEMRAIAETMLQSKATSDNNAASEILLWLSMDMENKVATMLSYIAIFLTKTGEKTVRLATKQAGLSDAQMQTLLTEQEYCYNFFAEYKELHHKEFNHIANYIFHRALSAYTRLKQERGYLDYSDIIQQAVSLFKNQHAHPWVVQNINYSIDHLLLDEAQDISRVQWEFLNYLIDDIILPSHHKTLFIVGDSKQSIYSFQGADYELFENTKTALMQRFKKYNKLIEYKDLNTSYRSAIAIVDNANKFCTEKFENVVMQQAFSGGAGSVMTHKSEGAQEMQSLIVNYVKDFIESEYMLASKGRVAVYDDVMILLPRRNSFATQIMELLEASGVVVAGLDRRRLSEIPVIESLCSALHLIEHAGQQQDMGVLNACVARILGSDVFGFTVEQMSEVILQPSLHQSTGMYGFLNDIRSTEFSSIMDAVNYIMSHDAFVVKYSGDAVAQYHVENFKGVVERFMQRGRDGSFLIWFYSHKFEVLRPDFASGVRINSVHGAKGLEAPIVIWVDLKESFNSPDFIMHDGYYYFRPPKYYQPEYIAQLEEFYKYKLSLEYNRLEYVAITRPQDALVVIGAV